MNLAIDTIVVPQGAEYQAVCRGLSQANSKNIRVIAIPMGMNNVAQTLVGHLEDLSNSKRILIMGLCGSLAPDYRVGDIALYQSCGNLSHDYLNLESELTARIQAKLSIDLVTGLTSDRLIYQAQEKRELGQKYLSQVVDMEGYAYISELQHQGISVAMLRVVSDDLTGDIPNLSTVIDPEGNFQTVPLAIALMQQPLAAIRLIKGSLTGLKILQQITTQLFL